MFEKLAEVEQLYRELEGRMADPALLLDMDEYRRVHKQYSDLTEIVANACMPNAASQSVMRKLGMARDPADDFDHPRLPTDSPLLRHVLYRLPREAWLARAELR